MFGDQTEKIVQGQCIENCKTSLREIKEDGNKLRDIQSL